METCIAGPAPLQPDEPQPLAGEGPRGGVLLVVDDPDLQSRLARRFSRGGYRVVGAPGAEAAVAVCRSWFPDLVLIDETVRGGHSGLEVARSLQRTLPRLRVVILGASDGSFERVDAIVAAAGTMLAEVADAAARKARPAPLAGLTSSGRSGGSARPTRSSARRR